MDTNKHKNSQKTVKAPAKAGQKTRRGRRIPQTAWPGILQQYQLGATLTKIAEDFDCTPSAISYIVKKAETIYGDLTGSHHLPTPTRMTTGSIKNPSQLRPRSLAELKGDKQAAGGSSQPPAVDAPAVDDMEQRLRDDAQALVLAYRAAMMLAGQLHSLRRSLAKLEITLSKQGIATQTSSNHKPTSRSRYATGWQAN